ncbi:MAG: hypothetical protein HYT93_00095 [Parcubacteria group bacterium]|nr:hypothetical protein [Parcubacteria group bacterium]
MENIYFKYCLLLFFASFSLGIILGHVFLFSTNTNEQTALVNERNSDIKLSQMKSKTEKLWVTLDLVNFEEQSIILSQIANPFFQVSGKTKVYFDDSTRVSVREGYTISNKFFYYDKDISFLNELSSGDLLVIYVQRNKERFYATQIIQYKTYKK